METVSVPSGMFKASQVVTLPLKKITELFDLFPSL